MKYIRFLIYLLITSQLLEAQTIPKDSLTGKFRYTDVVSLNKVSQEQLFERATNWFGGKIQESYFTRAKDWYKGKRTTDSLSHTDQTNGIISHKAAILATVNYSVYTKEMIVLFTISIEVKNESY